MSSIQVRVTDNASSNTSTHVLASGATVADAMAAAGVSGENYTIRVNRAPAEMCTTLFDGDSISFTRKDLKGAADEVPAEPVNLDIAFNDIINWGQRDEVMQGTAYERAVAAQMKEASQVVERVISGFLRDARQEAGSVNASVERAEQNLAKARDYKVRFEYCVNQLRNNNPFALLSFLGRKDEAVAICQQLGCRVPDSKSDVWRTSAAE